jgi:hypothetical protein
MEKLKAMEAREQPEEVTFTVGTAGMCGSSWPYAAGMA